MTGAPHLFAVLLITMAFPRLGISQQPKIVTVCELLANPTEYGNSVVAVVGRLDVEGVIFDRHNFIGQDHCDQPIKTENYVWPNKILIWTQAEKGLPNPPTDRPALDLAVLAGKISEISRDTTLGTRKEFRMDKEGNLKDFAVKNQWVVAYGHTFYSPNLTSAAICKGIGRNGFMRAPVVIVVDSKNVHTINDDGTLQVPKESKK